MIRNSSEPDSELVQKCKEYLEGMTTEQLDEYYCQFWQYLQHLPDHYSTTAELFWAVTFAIERLRRYQPGQVNVVRSR